MRGLKFPNFSIVLLFMLIAAGVNAQATITIEVNWPNWSSENRVTFRDPSNTQIGSRICNPAACYNGSGNNSYNNIGSPQTYTGVPYGTNYDIYLQDTYGDGWNGGGSYVRVYQDGILIVDSDLGGGSNSTVSFDIVAPSPTISIADVSVNENAGTATFTATHVGLDASGSFTVNFTTNDGTAIAGTDYTLNTGILSFNGTSGDTELITVPILDNTSFDGDKNFSIQFTSVSDPSVIITDTATGTIVDDEVVLGNTPLALFEELDGYMDYTSTGGTLRTSPNTGNPCAITTTSSNTLSSPIPAAGTIEKAILYWAHSGAAMDTQVTFEGATINAELVYMTTLTTRTFHGYYADVTGLINGIANPSTNVYDFSGLTVDTSSTYCNSATVLGGWSLMIFYTDTSLPASTINLYQGFDGNSNSSSTFTLSGFYAIGSTGSKTTALSWEGDQTLANNESLQFTTPLVGTNRLAGDGDNNGTTVNNPFNSTNYDNTTLPIVNNTATYGVDLDTYDVSAYILPGETSATTQVNVGQDFVIMNAVVLKVPSNLITGRVFEDVNYGGGAGRNYASASGVGLPGTTVELYNNVGTLIDTQITDASGTYVFAGMINGTYSIRVVSSTVASSRPGGSGCGSCLPVQTFKTEYIASTLVERPNEVGGADPSATDTGAGVLTGAQTIGAATITNEGVAGLDFGFNFNTIVNTNESGQGSLEQFIVNSNEIGETGLDIEANAIFDPVAGEDTSIFMIPPSGDPLGRTPDTNYASGYFDIFISNGAQLTELTGSNTIIDGRTQTAYSGDSNSGTIGSGGSVVGISATVLPNYNLPEIQVRGDTKEVFRNDGTMNTIRSLAVYLDDKTAIQVNDGSLNILENLIAVNALGVNTGDMEYGVEIKDGEATISQNYFSGSGEAAILIDGGTSTTITNNHFTNNGDSACKPSIEVKNGDGIVIQTNLIENSGGFGVDAENVSTAITIDQNTVTTSGFMGGGCLAGIILGDDDAVVTGNIIHTNGGAGLELVNNSSGNLISQNSFYANGTSVPALGIDFDQDGVTLNDNGDSDNGPNGGLNFPIITTAYISGSNFVVKGWARPGATLEFFLTDVNEGTATEGDNELGLSTDYGEGQIYLGTVIEGSGADLAAGTSSYTDVDGNTDNTNLFEFSTPIVSGVSIGDYITATATISNSTSEFSPMSILKVRTIITNRRITYRVSGN
ncbi:beta strand repeat-containing protein [Maribacter sp. HTCC2170]|uniref:beta strand repeat-containing protein n=1 Tax=Maribacter sp. (strain HTCC2170 / KCCM 42371) TaxID=313603 RepID=UPI00006B1AA4|nr:right-handed parallel beta-helix repeat-containing protein [Maribacter sp. HTCC2170]EAR00632.1 probable aggregation factor core protein MAFp3, isoform C [Maribacter sp. HTCC2170]